jgi:group I intron endonuclease
MIGVYKITNPTGKIYIGQAIDIERRFNEYRRMQGCKTQVILYRSLIKYGVDTHTFEVVVECEKEQLNYWERYYQDLFDSTGLMGLNCYLTKTNDKSGKLSEESIKKRQQTKIKNGTNKPSKETIEKRANTRRGKKVGPQQRITCPHCKKEGGISNMKKLHFDRCPILTGIKRKQSPRPHMIGNKYAKVHKGKPKEVVECPYCKQKGGKPQMIQWHFENCKYRVV